jgi:PadR family transcriptional regulator PadR
MDDVFENWTVQLRKGVLELCVLSAIGASDACYGYALVRNLVATPGLDVSEGSIYPLLSRLRKQGVVQTRLEESTSGPARKYYKLTALGKARMAAMQSYYDSLHDGVTTVRNDSK